MSDRVKSESNDIRAEHLKIMLGEFEASLLKEGKSESLFSSEEVDALVGAVKEKVQAPDELLMILKGEPIEDEEGV